MIQSQKLYLVIFHDPKLSLFFSCSEWIFCETKKICLMQSSSFWTDVQFTGLHGEKKCWINLPNRYSKTRPIFICFRRIAFFVYILTIFLQKLFDLPLTIESTVIPIVITVIPYLNHCFFDWILSKKVSNKYHWSMHIKFISIERIGINFLKKYICRRHNSIQKCKCCSSWLPSFNGNKWKRL